MIFALLLLFLLLYEPIAGTLQFRAFKARVAARPALRLRFYQQTMVGLWAPALVFLAAIAASGLSPAHFGLQGFALGHLQQPPLLPAWLGYGAIALGLLYLAMAAIELVMLASRPERRLTMARRFREETARSPFGVLLPVTAAERRWWIGVALTAGICEELLYRSFLLAYLPEVLPGLPLAAYVGASALIFGLAHLYQGLAGFTKATIAGAYFGVLYLALGTIWPVMALHAAIDLMPLALDSAEAAEDG